MRWALLCAAWGLELHHGVEAGPVDGVHKLIDEIHSDHDHGAGLRADSAGKVGNSVAVGMLSSRKEPYNTRAGKVRTTWAPYFSSFAAYTFDAGEAELWRRTLPLFGPEETHDRSTGLNLAMIPAMLADFPDAAWLVQVDDDTMLFPAAVQKHLEQRDSKAPLLMGACSRWPWHPHDLDGRKWGADEELSAFDAQKWEDDGFQGPFVIGGGGIFMSRKFAEDLQGKVLECRKKYNKMMYGDLRVAACAKDVYGAAALGTFGSEGVSFLDGSTQQNFTGGVVQCLPGATVVNEGVHFQMKAWTVKGPQDEGFQTEHGATETPVSISLKDPVQFESVWRRVHRKGHAVSWDAVGNAINKVEGEHPARHFGH